MPTKSRPRVTIKEKHNTTSIHDKANNSRKKGGQPTQRRPMNYVNGEDKDDKYWERREKNNMAARRSREARRLKENQIALRTAYLEKENGALQVALDKSAAENERLKEENKRLKEALDSYENGLLSLN